MPRVLEKFLTIFITKDGDIYQIAHSTSKIFSTRHPTPTKKKKNSDEHRDKSSLTLNKTF